MKFSQDVFNKAVNYFKNHRGEYVGNQELGLALGMPNEDLRTLTQRVRRKYPEETVTKKGFGTMWVTKPESGEVPVSPVNHEHYSDPTAFEALKCKPKKPQNKDILPNSVWKIGKSDGTTELMFVLSADEWYVHCLKVEDSDPHFTKTLLDITSGNEYFVDPDRLLLKPVKYFIEEDCSFCPDEGQIESIRAQVAISIGCYFDHIVEKKVEVPVEKIVEKIVEKKVDDSIEVSLLKQKVEIYELLLKAHNLLIDLLLA